VPDDRRKTGQDEPRTAEEWLAAPELKPLVTRIVRSHGLASQDADDVLQETLISLLRSGSDVRVSRAWICAVATRRSVDSGRRRARRSERNQAYVRGRSSSETRELRYLLYARAAELSPRERMFFELRHRQGMTEREIAAELGISRASVRRVDSLCRRSLME
jgi:RNA polymerase sigma factor (sigma-70 family)